MRTRALQAALALLGILFIIQLPRLFYVEFDSFCYLQWSVDLLEGLGRHCPRCQLVRCTQGGPPIGYPLMLTPLIASGLAAQWSIVLLNLLFLTAALLALPTLLRSAFGLGRDATLGIACLTLLSWPLIRYAQSPMSDAPFLGLAAGALWSMETAVRRPERRTVWLTVAVGLSALAILTRSIGIALLPSLVMAGRGGILPAPAGTPRLRPAHLAAGALAVVGTLGLLALTPYHLQVSRLLAHRGPAGLVWRSALARSVEFGQLFLNVPIGRRVPFAMTLIPMVGGVAFCTVIAVCWKLRRQLSVTSLFLISYLATLVPFPFAQARFVIPITPLVFGALAWGFTTTTLARIPRWAVAGYLVAFTAVGLVAHAYSTRLTYGSRAYFLTYFRPTNGIGAAYYAAFGVPLPPRSKGAQPHRVELIRRLEPRARPGGPPERFP